MKTYTKVLFLGILLGLFVLALYSATSSRSAQGRHFRQSSPAADSLLICPPEVVKAKKCPEFTASEIVAHYLVKKTILLNPPKTTNYIIKRKPIPTYDDDDDDDYSRSYYGGDYSGGGTGSGK